MSKEFKISAIVIVVLCIIFGYKENRQEKHYQSSISESIAKDEENYQQNTKLYKQHRDSIDFKNRMLNKIIHTVKPIKIKETTNEEDAIIGYMSFMAAKEKDSITRAKANPEELVNKMNYENTIILFYDKLEEDSVNLSAMINEQIQEEKKGRYNIIHGNCFNMHYDSAKTTIKRLAGLNYIAVVQKSVQKDPSLTDDKTFEAGFSIFKLSVFDINTLKKLKDMDVFASNSDRVGTLNLGGKSDAQIFLNADLRRECSAAIENSVYGEKDTNPKNF